jgi:hypothetical protein
MQKKDISYTTYIRDEGGCWLEKYIATEFKVISRTRTTTTDKLEINTGLHFGYQNFDLLPVLVYVTLLTPHQVKPYKVTMLSC